MSRRCSSRVPCSRLRLSAGLCERYNDVSLKSSIPISRDFDVVSRDYHGQFNNAGTPMRTLRKFDVGGAREAGSDLVQTTPAQRRRNSGQRGSTLVEYALTLVISFVLLFAIIDFGRALYSYHFVNYAAREAARFASMRGANSCGGTVSPCSVTSGDISNFVQQITPAGIDAG